MRSGNRVRRFSVAAAALVALVPFAFWGLPTANAATPLQGAASALANSKYGPVAVVVSTGGASGTITLSVTASRHTYTFQIPAGDFKQSGSSATLDTRGDLKSYGTIHITWARKVVGIPPTSTKCGGTTKGVTVVNFTQGTGTANLKLPCLGSISLHFGGPPGRFPSSPLVPGMGYYTGFVGTVFATLPNNANVSLTVYKSTDPRRHLQAGGFITREYRGGSTAPLVSQFQQFHVTIRTPALTVSPDLGTASLSLPSGPGILKGTSLQWTATAPAQAVGKPTTTSTGCVTGRSTGGGERFTKIGGTLGIQTCALSGRFTLDSTRTFGEVYSSQLKAKVAVPPKILTVTPPDHATGVPTTLSTVVVHFSHHMVAQTSFASLQGGSGNTLDVKALTNPTTNSNQHTLTWTITPAGLKPNTVYTLNITASDTNHQTVNGKTTFTTGP